MSSENTELYIPRKCSVTGRLIKPSDHSSVAINIAMLDEEGHFIPGEVKTYNLSGFVRSRGEADDSLNRLAQEDGILEDVFKYSH